MVTALIRHEDRVRGLEVGANYYLTKPFSEAQLHRAVHEALTWRDDLKRRGHVKPVQELRLAPAEETIPGGRG